MADQVIKNNVVEVLGTIISNFKFSHEVYGEGFYSFLVEVPRLSDTKDIIPVIVSERLINTTEDMTGTNIAISGQFRSYNKHENGKSKLVLSVFARDINKVDEIPNKNPNIIYLDGFLCKNPIYRTTPFGREITDLLFAVNRPYNKSDYIPAIAWGRNAKYAKQIEVGTRVKVWGRIQSRNYQKKLGNDQYVNKTAYEISVSKMEIAKDTDQPIESVEEND